MNKDEICGFNIRKYKRDLSRRKWSRRYKAFMHTLDAIGGPILLASLLIIAFWAFQWALYFIFNTN